MKYFVISLKQSGVVILGWYLCQPVCRRRRRAQPPELERLKSQARLSRHTEYVSLFGALSRIVFAQPLSILPKRVAKHVSSPLSPPVPQTVQPQSSSTISVDVSDGFEDSISEPKFGPVTAEEVGLNKTEYITERELN